MTLRLITPPTGLVVSLAEAKAHLRITDATDDVFITAMINAATETAEHLTGRALMVQTWEAGFDSLESLKLPRAPVQNVTSITYTDAAGLLQTLTPALYSVLFDETGYTNVIPAYNVTLPTHRGDIDGVKVRFVAGYASAALVPQSIKSWMLLHVGSQYEHRESEVTGGGVASLGFADRLLDRYRVYG